MRDFFSKLKFVVSLICIFLVFILFIAIYFVYCDLSEKKNEKEYVSDGITKAEENKTKLEGKLEKLEKEINEYEGDQELKKESARITNEYRRLQTEKEKNDVEEKQLEELKKTINNQKAKLDKELKAVNTEFATLSAESAKLKKEEEGLKDAPNSEKEQELKTKKDELDKKLKSYSSKKIEYENKIKQNARDNAQYEKDMYALEERKGTYENERKTWEDDKKSFDERYKERGERLNSLNGQKYEVESNLNLNVKKHNNLVNRSNELDEEIDSLRKLSLILFCITFLLIILLVIFCISEIKKRKRMQYPKRKVAFNDPYGLKQEKSSYPNNTSIGEETAFRFGENSIGTSEQEVNGLRLQFQRILNDFGKKLEGVENRVSALENIVSALVKGRREEEPRKNNSFDPTASMPHRPITKPTETGSARNSEKTSLSNNAISDLYSSSFKREERNGKGEIIKYDKYLKLDEYFYSKVLDGQGEGVKAILIEGGEYNKAEFILINDKLYFNFYCYNETKEFPERDDEAIRARRYIFNFEGDECGKVIWCSPARVQKIEDKYVVIEKGYVLMKK